MHILRRCDLVDIPWKNGGGITRNIAKGTLSDKTVWTISRADVAQNGLFSDFIGMLRVLTVVSGGPMILETPAGPLNAELWKPVHFDGGWKIRSRLINGPLTDLNVMFDPQICDGAALIHKGPAKQQITCPKHGIVAVHILSGSPAINGVTFDTGDSAVFENTDAVIALAKDDTLLEIRVSPLDHITAIKLCMAKR
jgi:environmental stress-induced protein Ves